MYKIKTYSYGYIEQFKARLVEKGYSQQYCMIYEETFALVSKMTIVHTLFIVSSIIQWCISQLAANNAFLNGEKKFIWSPLMAFFHDYGYVCKLKKTS